MIGRFEALRLVPGKRLRTLCFLLTTAGIAILAIAVVALANGVVFNYTHSAPFGLYKGIAGSRPIPHEPGLYAFFCPDNRWPFMRDQPNYRSPMRTCPDGYAPLIKPVVAWTGDTVQTSGVGITVNGRMIPHTLPIDRDSAGRIVHPYPFGTYLVEPDQVWVVSSFSPRSFDSRYFGPIPVRCVRAWVRPFWVEKSYKFLPNNY
jgi:conjugative transfer signal peptidase TraF